MKKERKCRKREREGKGHSVKLTAMGIAGGPGDDSGDYPLVITLEYYYHLFTADYLKGLRRHPTILPNYDVLSLPLV